MAVTIPIVQNYLNSAKQWAQATREGRTAMADLCTEHLIQHWARMTQTDRDQADLKLKEVL